MKDWLLSMDERFSPEESLYRAVYPPELASMFWRKDGTLSSAAFADPKGLSVDRGYFRKDSEVVDSMRKRFTGVTKTRSYPNHNVYICRVVLP